MKTDYIKTIAPQPFFGAFWTVNDVDLAEEDNISILVEKFLEEHPHNCDYTLAVYDVASEFAAMIVCNISEIPEVVSYIYHLENATPLTFIGENLVTESYVVGLTCKQGNLNFPGIYKYENKKLIKLI